MKQSKYWVRRKWISIRKRYPSKKGTYLIQDCRHGHFGKAYYNGYDWEDIQISKVSLFLATDSIVTHWHTMEEE